MGPVLGMLEERETAARVRVEGLRKEVARLAEVLEAAEIDLDWRVIAREELVEALPASAAATTSVTGSEAEEEAAPSLARVPGSTVPPWREGLPVTVLAPDYQRILGVREQQRSTGHGPLSHGDGEGRGSAVESAAPGGARLAPLGGVRGLQCRPAARGRPRRRLIRVTTGRRIIASLVAGRVS